jgi:hypothetical protein
LKPSKLVSSGRYLLFKRAIFLLESTLSRANDIGCPRAPQRY